MKNIDNKYKRENSNMGQDTGQCCTILLQIKVLMGLFCEIFFLKKFCKILFYRI